MANQTKSPSKQKQLKISARFQGRQFNYVGVPEIRLCGKWLKQLGFNSGQSVTVTQKHGKILIVANPNPSIYAKG
ncbi:MAG: SymE family type I addiction module toxin [Bacteroidia bacterium]